MSIAFDRPFFAILILFIVPGLVMLGRFLKPLFTLSIALGPPGGTSFKAPANSVFVTRLLFTVEMSGVILLLAAAAGPHFSYTETLWLNRGADIIFLLDASPSMAALDMMGRSRFETAKDLVRDFASRRPSDSLGLAALGEDAALLVPLTTDRETFFTRLDSLLIGELGDGTALGMGIGIAALHIGRSEAPRRAVVLVTDGENNAGAVHPETAAAILADMGVSFWVIGVGSRGEVPIDYIDPITRVRRAGTFYSQYDPAVLQNMALKGNGRWLMAPSADAFESAFALIDNEEMTIRRSSVIRRKEPIHFFIIAAGFLLTLIARFLRINIFGAYL